MYNHNKAQQSKNRVHISWDILYFDDLQYCMSICLVFSDYFIQVYMYFILILRLDI